MFRQYSIIFPQSNFPIASAKKSDSALDFQLIRDSLSFPKVLALIYNVYIKFMRSLFTQDIPVATPKHNYYDKQLYFNKHVEEVKRFGPKNPQHKRVFQWYQPPKKVIEPIQKDSSIVKPHQAGRYSSSLDKTQSLSLSKSVLLSRNQSYEITGKVTQGISVKKNDVLMEAAKKSLMSSFVEDMNRNPYFPHKYVNKHEENTSRLTGCRDWNEEVKEHLIIPSPYQQYFPKWS